MEFLMKSNLLKIFSLLILIFSVVTAIDEPSARESKCINVTTRAYDPDPEWVSSVKTWYYPLASRLDLYRVVHDLWKTDYKRIPEATVYYDGCLQWEITAEGYNFQGFNGKTAKLPATPVGVGAARFKSDWEQGMAGMAYTTLTDNKTFIFTAACFDDDQMSWNVFSTKKTLDEKTKQSIFQHAKELGYNPDYFTEMRYDSCRQEMKTPMVEKTPPLSGKTSLNKNGFLDCQTCQQHQQSCLNNNAIIMKSNRILKKYRKELQICKKLCDKN